LPLQLVTVEEPVGTHTEIETEIEARERTEWRTEIESREYLDWETVEEPVVVVKTRTVPRLVTQWVEEEYEDIEYETYEVPVTIREDVEVERPFQVLEDVEVDYEVEVTGMALPPCTHWPSAHCSVQRIPHS
jgi:hypothetical protein